MCSKKLILIVTLTLKTSFLLYEATSSSKQVNFSFIEDSGENSEFNYLNQGLLNFSGQRMNGKQFQKQTSNFVMTWRNNIKRNTSRMKREIIYNRQLFNTDYEKSSNRSSNITGPSFASRQVQPRTMFQSIIEILARTRKQIEDFFIFHFCPKFDRTGYNIPFKFCPEGKLNS